MELIAHVQKLLHVLLLTDNEFLSREMVYREIVRQDFTMAIKNLVQGSFL